MKTDSPVHLPSEWHPQAALWMAWPHNVETWPDRLPRIQKQFAAVMAIASRYQPVRVLACGEARPVAEKAIDDACVSDERARRGAIELVELPTNDVWIRDYGPQFVRGPDGSSRMRAFTYYAWGGKFPSWEEDAAVPERLQEVLELPCERSELIGEGGGIEVNGEGWLLTTEAVLQNSNRNPDWGRAAVEAELRQLLGVREIAWLGEGLAGDDTDGHIDNLARFFAADGIVAMEEGDASAPHYHALQENRERLESLRTPSGGRFDLAMLPLPDPMSDPAARSERLPASYANFVILNGAVLVPTFDQPKPDEQARGLLSELFSGREVIPVDCRDWIVEGGALHCATLHQTAIQGRNEAQKELKI